VAPAFIFSHPYSFAISVLAVGYCFLLEGKERALFRWPELEEWGTVGLFLAACLSLFSRLTVPFLYFQF
jgi:hypothetical protein